ncbi:MAG: SseB family protein [Oscillospiraceae bacterium]|nr:SseB family protein [Oscillospiraceae bacterium]
MSEKIQPISNPALKEAIERMHAGEHSREAQMVTLQLLLKAQLLAPVSVTHEKGDAQIHFQLLSTQDDRAFFPAFTDLAELHKCFDRADQQTLVLTFSDYARMILKDKSAQGLVINPLGNSLTLEPPLVEYLDNLPREEDQKK